ncbi:MAG: asparagine synthase (glutamine-hydrolyzing), partial [Flavobacteriales bacterium]
RTLLTESVQDRMVSDVPLGAFLSGGMDSSIVAALAAKQVSTLSTFSIGFKDQPLLDETDDAKRVAEFIRSDHHAFKLTEADLVEHTERFLTHLDEPFADASSIAVSYLAKQTKKKVTVALSGDGADELFGGYTKHRGHALAMKPGNFLLPKSILKHIQTSREGKWQNTVRKMQRYLEAAKLSEEERYHYWARFSSLSTVQSILRGSIYQAPYLTANSQLNNVLFNDQALVLPGDMLHKVDLMSMRYALEVRTPFLDQRIICYANALPPKEKYNAKIGKLPLRSSFADLLPASVFEKKKHGFEIPLESLLRGPLSKRLKALIETDVFDGRFFNTVAISAYIQSFLEGENKYLSIVWSLFVFSEWEKNEASRFKSTADHV